MNIGKSAFRGFVASVMPRTLKLNEMEVKGMESMSVVLNSTNESGEVGQRTFDQFLLIGFDEKGNRIAINKLNQQMLGYCAARLQAQFNKLLIEEE